jgi:3',5'-cyclic AMP phosphodiesterase CpdA
MRTIFALAICALGALTPAAAQRPIVYIRDLQLGLGEKTTGQWEPKEDFRSPEIIKPFLAELTKTYGDGIDLVILGDLFELWQPSNDIKCDSGDPNLGCTVSQMAAIAKHVAGAHAGELMEIGSFAMRGDNCVYVVPGNHDAALLEDAVWREVFPKFNASEKRVLRVPCGVWSSGDGLVIGEHGHQIAPDANLYPNWPTVTRKPWWRREKRMVRPWGEYFVQSLFNAEEEIYPLVDNVTGLAGAKIRMKNRGIVATVADLARLVRFVLFESSASQQRAVLAPPPSREDRDRPQWDVAYARTKIGELVMLALPNDDPTRAMLATPAVRADFEALVKREMSDEEIEALCAAIPATGASSHPCKKPQLGHLLRSTIIPKSYILRKHLSKRRAEFRSAAVFVYGHTHSLEQPWPLTVDGHVVRIVNTGAFHRITDAATFTSAATTAQMSPGQALKDLPFDFMPPCHTAVVITRSEGLPVIDVKQWTSGGLVDACSGECARVSGCPVVKEKESATLARAGTQRFAPLQVAP